MKKYFYLPLLALALGVSNVVNAQDFNTSSGYMNSGSAYSSNVTAVGSTGVDYPNPTDQGVANRGRGGDFGENQDGGTQGTDFPIGSSAILFVFAAVAAGVIAIRRRKAA